MRGIGGHEQRGPARMARRKMQRQSAGDGRLPYSAFPHDKGQLGHRVIVSGESVERLSPRIYADGRRLRREFGLYEFLADARQKIKGMYHERTPPIGSKETNSGRGKNVDFLICVHLRKSAADLSSAQAE